MPSTSMTTKPAPPSANSRGANLARWGILVLALMLRIWAWTSIQDTWDATHPRVDAYTYWQQTVALLQGQDPFSQGYYQPPGYPWLLRLQQSLLDTPDPRLSRAFNLLFGLLSAAGIGRIAKRSSDWPWAGPAAMALFVLAGAPLRFELDLLTPAATTLLTVITLNLLLPTKPRLGPALSLPAGLCAGAAVLIHPSFLLAFVLLAAWTAWTKPLTGALFALGLALPIAPIAAQNHSMGSSSLISENGGLNLYLFNNPDWKRTAFLRPGLPFRALVLQAQPHERDQFERNQYWKERTKRELEPASALAAVLEKSWWSIHNREIPRNEDWRCRTQDSSLSWTRWLPTRTSWIFPLALLGLLVLGRRARLTLPLTWLGLHLPLLIFLPAERYRMAAFPLLCVLAAVGMPELRRALLARSRRLPLLLIPLTLAFWPIDHVTAMQPGWCAHRQGNLAYEQDRMPEAEVLYLRATQAEPQNSGHWYWLAQSRLAQRDTQGAVAALERTAELFPAHYETRKQLQKEHGRLGQWSAAAEHAGAGCALPGAATIMCARYVQLLVRAGRPDQARSFLSEHPELRSHERVRKLGL